MGLGKKFKKKFKKSIIRKAIKYSPVGLAVQGSRATYKFIQRNPKLATQIAIVGATVGATAVGMPYAGKGVAMGLKGLSQRQNIMKQKRIMRSQSQIETPSLAQMETPQKPSMFSWFYR